MTDDTINATVDAIREIAARNGISVERIVVFGSYADGDATDDSDIDIVIVSDDWEGVNFYERPRAFLINWPYDDLPEPDVHPLTPDEFAERSRANADIISTARETGVEV